MFNTLTPAFVRFTVDPKSKDSSALTKWPVSWAYEQATALGLRRLRHAGYDIPNQELTRYPIRPFRLAVGWIWLQFRSVNHAI